MSSLASLLNQQLAEQASSARSALVQVSASRTAGGSGVVVHPDGLVLTAAHVLRGRRSTVRLMDGRRLEAVTLAIQRELDLAAISVELSGAPAMQVGSSDHLRPGDWVIALGHPWGVRGGATAGVVIGVGAELPEAPREPHATEWLATSLHLRPGHSGGPLVDSRGRLVGINTRMNGPDVGLSVPASVVRRFLRESLGSEHAPAAQAA